MPRKTLFEACVESTEFALAAERGGADRIELCTDLDIGGVTPPQLMIAETRRVLSIPVHVLIRPRGGDFRYTNDEFELMKSDVLSAKRAGVDGIVVGILNEDRTVDAKRTGVLVELARPMSVTFHRAFDETPDPHRALDDIIGVGIDRLLTSGRKPAAIEGVKIIKELVEWSAGRIIVMPGGGVREENARAIIEQTGAREIHGSLRGAKDEMTSADYSARVREFIGVLP